MKLPKVELSISDAMAEFDLWITPSLGEIRDTDKFREMLAQCCAVMDILDEATSGFADVTSCQADVIADTTMRQITSMTEERAQHELEALGILLYLITGSSDNNGKCQLPIYLRDRLRVTTLPRAVRGGVADAGIPRVLDVQKYMKQVAALGRYPEVQRRMLGMFLDFVLAGTHSADQLWALGYSYHQLKAVGRHAELLSPLVVLQVRGSVSASGGHDPERILREQMETWGLVADVDFNTADVSIDELTQTSSQKAKKKVRKFDFALPYQSPGWKPRVLVQCQFYAGDSGSVSHKNVDQTPTGRTEARTLFEKAGLAAPLFVEYVDGAGYFASLNGDLRHILEIADTESFFQIRSAAVRLRRELQTLGFLTRIEVEQALLRVDSDRSAAEALLLLEGYSATELQRRAEWLTDGLTQERRDRARRYLVLDLCASMGKRLTSGGLAGSLMCPGYGPFWGTKLDELSRMALQTAPTLREDWVEPPTFLQDVRWLCEHGHTALA